MRFIAALLLLCGSIWSADTTGVVLGTVTDSVTGDPLDSAFVVLRTTGSGSGLAGSQALDSAWTDSEGSFSFDSLVTGSTLRYALTVSLRGYMTQTTSVIRLDSAEIETLSVEMLLLDTATPVWLVLGTVTADSANGIPVAGAEVTLVERYGSNSYTAVTDDSGRYEMSVPSVRLTYTFTVTAEGFTVATTQKQIAADSVVTDFILRRPTTPNETKGLSGITAFHASPNPFQSSVAISFSSAISGDVRLTVVSADGKQVHRQTAVSRQTGHTMTWNAADLPAGVYVVSLEQAGKKQTRRIILAR